MPSISMKLPMTEVEEIVKGAIRERYNLNEKDTIELSWDIEKLEINIDDSKVKQNARPFQD